MIIESKNGRLNLLEMYIKESFPKYWETHVQDPGMYPVYPEVINKLQKEGKWS